MAPKIAVIYYSMGGHTYQLARAVADGAEAAGADVRLRQVPELAPPEVIEQVPFWKAHRDDSGEVPVAAAEDLVWADGFAFGTPTRFGNPAAQLRQFIDTTGPLWAQGAFVDKPATSFTGAQTGHGGHESTILALNNTFYHWGCVIVPLGYTDPLVFKTGNPYGATWVSRDREGPMPDETALAVARYQGRRLTAWAAARPAAKAYAEDHSADTTE